MAGILKKIKKKKNLTEHRNTQGEHHVMTETGIGVMQP